MCTSNRYCMVILHFANLTMTKYIRDFDEIVYIRDYMQVVYIREHKRKVNIGLRDLEKIVCI